MASARESICQNDPNFAVICSFLNRYGDILGIPKVSFAELQTYLEETKYVSDVLIDLHVRLLRKLGKTSANFEKWERSVMKFCYSYSGVDGWEMEELGYPKVALNTRLRILKNLLEAQFDNNNRFKDKINEIDSSDLRFLPIGRDRNGLAYWYLIDDDFNLRVYREEQDDEDAESWKLVCSNRNDLASLISDLEHMKDDPLEKDKLSTSSGDSDDKEEAEAKVKVEPKDEKEEDEDADLQTKVKAENPEVKKCEMVEFKKESTAPKSPSIKTEPGFDKEKTSRDIPKDNKTNENINLKAVKTEPNDHEQNQLSNKTIDASEMATSVSGKKSKTDPVDEKDNRNSRKSAENVPEKLKGDSRCKENTTLSITDSSDEFVFQISPVKKVSQESSEKLQGKPIYESDVGSKEQSSSAQKQIESGSVQRENVISIPEESSDSPNKESLAKNTVTKKSDEAKKTLPDSDKPGDTNTGSEKTGKVEGQRSKLDRSLSSDGTGLKDDNGAQKQTMLKGTQIIAENESEFQNKRAKETVEQTSLNTSMLIKENEKTINKESESNSAVKDSVTKDLKGKESESNVRQTDSEIANESSKMGTEHQCAKKSDDTAVKVIEKNDLVDSMGDEKKVVSESETESSVRVSKELLSNANDKKDDLGKDSVSGSVPKGKDVVKTAAAEEICSSTSSQSATDNSCNANKNLSLKGIPVKPLSDSNTESQPILEPEYVKTGAVDSSSKIDSKKEDLPIPEVESEHFKHSDSDRKTRKTEPGKCAIDKLSEADSKKEDNPNPEAELLSSTIEEVSERVDISSKESNEIKKPKKNPEVEDIQESTKGASKTNIVDKSDTESKYDSGSKQIEKVDTKNETASEKKSRDLKQEVEGEISIKASATPLNKSHLGGKKLLGKGENQTKSDKKKIVQSSDNLPVLSDKSKKELTEIIQSEKETDKKSKSDDSVLSPPQETKSLERDQPKSSEKLVSKKEENTKTSKHERKDSEKLETKNVKPSVEKSLAKITEEEASEKYKGLSKSVKENISGNSKSASKSCTVKSIELKSSSAEDKSEEAIAECDSLAAEVEHPVSKSTNSSTSTKTVVTAEKSVASSKVKIGSVENPDSVSEAKCSKPRKIQKKGAQKLSDELSNSNDTETSHETQNDSITKKVSPDEIKVLKSETKSDNKEKISKDSTEPDPKIINRASKAKSKDAKSRESESVSKTGKNQPSVKAKPEETMAEEIQKKPKTNESQSTKLEKDNKTADDTDSDENGSSKETSKKSDGSSVKCPVEKDSDVTKDVTKSDNCAGSSNDRSEPSSESTKKSAEIIKENEEGKDTELVEKKLESQRGSRKQKLCVKEDSSSLVIAECEVSQRTGRPVRSTRNKSPRGDYSTLTRGAVAGRGSGGKGRGGGGRGGRSTQKATKRPVEIPVESSEQSSPETEDEPAAKQARRGRAKGRGKGRNRGRTSGRTQTKQPLEDSDETDDDVPLSKINTPQSKKGRGKSQPGGAGAKSPKEKTSETPVRKSSRPRKRKKVQSDEEYQVKQTRGRGGGNGRKPRGRNRKTASTSDEDTDKELEEEEDRLVCEALAAQTSSDELTFHTSSEENIEEESEDDYLPQKKGRNARRAAVRSGELLEPDKGEKEESETDIDDDTPCCKCLKSNQPEWILLCDKCDASYHTACLRPPLMIIPSGDWYCPSCQHIFLVGKLCENLKELDTALKKFERLIKRKERLAYVGISLDNIVKEDRKENVAPEDFEDFELFEEFEEKRKKKHRSSSHRDRHRHHHHEHHRERPVKEEVFTQRSCRARSTISYQFKEFDELIDDAIQDDVKEPPPPGISRGKDMFNIEEAEREPSPVSKKRKKRRLTKLDDDDDDDDDSEEYKATDDSEGTPAEEEEADTCVSTSDDDYKWRSIRTRRFGKPTRSSSRKGGRWTRYDADFVVEDDYDSEGSDGNRRSTRSATKRRVCYREVNSGEETASTPSEGESSSDDSGYRRKRPKIQKKTQKKQRRQPTKRKGVLYSDESEEEEEESENSSEETPAASSGEESGPTRRSRLKKKRVSDESAKEASENSSGSDSDKDTKVQRSKQIVTRKAKVKRVIDSDTEEEESNDDKKSKPEKKLNVKNFAKDKIDSENSENSENEEEEEEDEKQDGDSEEENCEVSDKNDSNDKGNVSVPCKPRGIKITPTTSSVIKRKLSPEEHSGEQSTIDPDSPDISQSPKVSNSSSNGNSVDEMGPVAEPSPANGIGYDQYTPQMPPSYSDGYGGQYPYYSTNQPDTYQPQGFFQPSQTNNPGTSPTHPASQAPLPQSGAGPHYTTLPSLDSRNRGDSMDGPQSRDTRPSPNPAPQYQELHPPNGERRRQGMPPQSGFVRPDSGRPPYPVGPDGRPIRPNPPPRGSFMMENILRPKGYGEGDDDDLSDVSDLISYVTQDS